ncbi:hypothetical protein G9A89_003015 [Geosiphon pyriformis]|nr:hypothetical protein G9A89_003015 [Geosiphon pyriformis]
MVFTKIKEALPKEIKTIKNNLPEPIKLDWGPNSDIVLDSIDPEQFHKNYQELTHTKKEQEQHLEQLNTQLLVKKKINIQGGIIDTEYVKNIIAMLQNNSEKTYIIEPNKKIAQAIFLSLVKVVQLVLVENREKLGITARGINGFEFTNRIDIPVNMTEEKYMLMIEKKVKDQAQIFEAEPTICESEEIGLTNLYIPAKNYYHIKISIYNMTGDIVKIPKETIIEYLTTKVEDQLPNHISDFSQLCKYVNITLQAIYG